MKELFEQCESVWEAALLVGAMLVPVVIVWLMLL